jgi:hypothetical protein
LASSVRRFQASLYPLYKFLSILNSHQIKASI